MLNKVYCTNCYKNHEEHKSDQPECIYVPIVRTIFGYKFLHIDCPDQKNKIDVVKSKNTPAAVDLLFKDNQEQIIEVEHKSINVDVGHKIAHDKAIELFRLNLQVYADEPCLLEIAFKKPFKAHEFKQSVKKINQIYGKMALDECIGKNIYDDENCKLSVVEFPDEFNPDNYIQNLLMSFPSTSPTNGDGITIENILQSFNGDGISTQINNYLKEPPIRKKYIEKSSQKVILFGINFGLLLTDFLTLLNEQYPTFKETVITDIYSKIENSDFFDMVIVALEEENTISVYYQENKDSNEVQFFEIKKKYVYNENPKPQK